MKVSRDDVENRQTILHIEVEEDRVERHLQRAHTKVSQRINIPGFRKGKTPISIINKKYRTKINERPYRKKCHK